MVRGHPMTVSLVTLTKRVGARMALRQGGNLMPQDLAVDCSILWVDGGLPGFGYSKGIPLFFIDRKEKGKLIIGMSKISEIY